MTIEWRPIPGFPDYEVSNTGLVRSYKRKKPRILKTGGVPGAHRTVVLRQNGENRSFKVGALVLFVFRGPCPEGYEACHNDGNPTNDHLDNLRWDTHAANMQDAGRHWIRKQLKSQTFMAAENGAFVNAVGTMQKELEMTQGEFAEYLGFSRVALCKFYAKGVKDGIIIKILRKFPHLAYCL